MSLTAGAVIENHPLGPSPDPRLADSPLHNGAVSDEKIPPLSDIRGSFESGEDEETGGGGGGGGLAEAS